MLTFRFLTNFWFCCWETKACLSFLLPSFFAYFFFAYFLFYIYTSPWVSALRYSSEKSSGSDVLR